MSQFGAVQRKFVNVHTLSGANSRCKCRRAGTASRKRRTVHQRVEESHGRHPALAGRSHILGPPKNRQH